MFRRLRVAEITDAFRALTQRLQDEPAYVAPEAKGGMPVITVHRQFDPEDEDDGGYFFAERAGRDSVAFLLHDRGREEAPYGVLTQWHGPLRRFSTGAFTGSMDKAGLDPVAITVEEAAEEAGYAVPPERVLPMAVLPVSGQCNEQCALFLVDVTGLRPQPLRPENIFEQNMQQAWWTQEQVLAAGDWKARVIALANLRG